MKSKLKVHPATPKEIRQIKAYLAQKAEERKRWANQQKTNQRNRTWKRDLVAASQTQKLRDLSGSGGSLRPDDGTFFYAPGQTAHERRVQALEETILDYVSRMAEAPVQGTGLAEYAAEAVSSRTAELLSDLELLAVQGDPRAIEAYARLTRRMVSSLNRLALPKASQLRRLASQCLNWPVLMGRGSINSDDFKSILDSLGVGTNLPFSKEATTKLERRSHKRLLRLAMELACRLEDWRTREPSSIVWYQAISAPTDAERNAGALKPFAKATWSDWFEAAWQILMEENKDHPEKHPDLRPLGLYRENHSLLQAQQRNPTHKTVESNIRDGIREKLKQAFKQMSKRTI
jgi:hypothetical protein